MSPKEGIFFFLSLARHTRAWWLFDAAWSMRVLGSPDLRTQRVNGGRPHPLPCRATLPCNQTCLVKVAPGLHNPSASRGQRRRQPIVPHQIPSWAAVKRLLWKAQKRLPVSITWRKRLGHNEVHCGCDWHWICYLCITTYIESSLTLRPSFKGHSSAAE